jgi:hypothetical protein
MVGQQANEYYRRHKDVVSPPLVETGMSADEIRDATMKKEHRGNLHRLGLIDPQRKGRKRITPLGRMLLEYVDIPDIPSSKGE